MKVSVKKLDPRNNVSKSYLRWMNDFEVHKYTEQKYKKHNKIANNTKQHRFS